MANFTNVWLKSVQPPGSGYKDYMDGTSGLGVRVRSSGRKVWFARYTFDKAQTRHNLGEFPAMPLARAREALADLNRKVEMGVDPKGRRVSIDGMSVRWLCDEYIERYAKPNKKSWKTDEYHLDKEVKPNWGERHVSAITKKDVIDLVDGIVDRGARVHAGRVLATIAKMFNWAVDRDYITTPPTYRVKPTHRGAKRSRVLTETEIIRLWHALDEPQHFSRLMVIALKLMLILGQRRGEVIGMRIDEIDLKRKLWQLPAERTKAGRAHLVPLPDLAIPLIRLAMQLSASKKFVFATKAAESIRDDDEGDTQMIVTGPTRAISRNREWLQGKGIAPFTVHDLRRTVASHMPRLGVPRAHVTLVLNHAQPGMTAEVYDWYEYLPEKKKALDIWAERLEGLISGKIEAEG